LKAVFVNPFPGGKGLNEATVLPPLGLGYIAAVLEQHGFSSMIIDANLEQLDTDKVLKRLPEDTRLLGIYLNSFNYDSTADLCRNFNKIYPEVAVVLGGPLASACPKHIIEQIPCDGLIRGEGEYSVLKLFQNITKGITPFDDKIDGAVYYDISGELNVNPPERIRDLDRIPFPAFHLMPPFKKYKVKSKQRPTAAIITTRGCSHECIFCSKDIFERKVTFRSAESVLQEVDFLVKNYDIRQLDILDDNFMQNRSRVEQILDGLIEKNYGLSLNLQSGIRAEHLDEDILKKMKQAGFYKIGFGVESADPEVLKIIKKRLDLSKITQAIGLAKKTGFEVYGFFIIGLPGETEASFKKTINFACNAGFDIANFCMAIPFVGTELHSLVQQNGRFLIDTTKNISCGFYGGKVFFEYAGSTQADILRRYKTAYKQFYTLKKKTGLLFKIRSIKDIRWLFDASMSVFKGMRRQ